VAEEKWGQLPNSGKKAVIARWSWNSVTVPIFLALLFPSFRWDRFVILSRTVRDLGVADFDHEPKEIS